MDHLFELDGLPDSIVSDRDLKFTARFWEHLLKRCGVKLNMSTSHHLQTNGSSEVMNQMLENYLQSYCNVNMNDWDELLSTTEFFYNSSKTEGTKVSPFELDKGWQPRCYLHLISKAGASSIESVNDLGRRLGGSNEDAALAHNSLRSILHLTLRENTTLDRIRLVIRYG